MVLTLEDVIAREFVMEKFFGCVKFDLNGKRVFYGAATVWSRQGSRMRRIVAFFDQRPEVLADHPQAKLAPETVRIR